MSPDALRYKSLLQPRRGLMSKWVPIMHSGIEAMKKDDDFMKKSNTGTMQDKSGAMGKGKPDPKKGKK